jgi:hypothetical protein
VAGCACQNPSGEKGGREKGRKYETKGKKEKIEGKKLKAYNTYKKGTVKV